MDSSEIRLAEGDEKTSMVLVHLAAHHPGPAVTMGEVVAALGERGLGLSILVLALPNLLPGPAMPGYSTLFGIPIAVLSARLLGRDHDPHLPRWIERRSLALPRFRALVLKVAPSLRRVEALLHPRPSWLNSAAGIRLVGTILLATALFLAIPVPLGGWLPAIAIVALALGLIEHDSRALAAGIAMAVLSWFWVIGLLVAGAELLALFGRWLA